MIVWVFDQALPSLGSSDFGAGIFDIVSKDIAWNMDLNGRPLPGASAHESLRKAEWRHGFSAQILEGKISRRPEKYGGWTCPTRVTLRHRGWDETTHNTNQCVKFHWPILIDLLLRIGIFCFVFVFFCLV